MVSSLYRELELGKHSYYSPKDLVDPEPIIPYDKEEMPTTKDVLAKLDVIVPRLEQETEQLQDIDPVPKTYNIRVFTASRPLVHWR